ncbi:hypothetical protein [Pseudaeromonas paramecii]|uniref:Uncharacterized protein n=1 Tax=Pseudaeromonas paramecii TaxID=2138166 RepID=A0ABP8QM53_9GAMM
MTIRSLIVSCATALLLLSGVAQARSGDGSLQLQADHQAKQPVAMTLTSQAKPNEPGDYQLPWPRQDSDNR